MTLDAHGFLYDVTGTGLYVHVSTLYVHVSTDSTVLRLRKLRLAPKRQTVESAVIGTVTLTANAPATGALVALASSDAGVTVPLVVPIPAGARSADVAIALDALPAANPVTISASFGCITKTASLTVLPSAGRLSP